MVNSVNTTPQYERQFSLGKTATSALAGAALFKVSNDAILHKNASNTMTMLRGANADEFIKTANLSASAVKRTVRESQKVLKNTQYIEDLKNIVKNPKGTAKKVSDFVTNTVKNPKNVTAKAKDFATKTFKEGGIKTKAKGFIENIVSTAKSLKGGTVKETISNVLKATKTVKGRQAVNVALGVVCGLMMFGTSKVIKKDENQA